MERPNRFDHASGPRAGGSILPTPKEIAELVSAADSMPGAIDFQDVVSIVANTGIRPAELCQLRWSDVDFERRCLSIGALGGARTRRIPLGDKALAVLRVRCQRQPNGEFVLGGSPRLVLERVSRRCRLLSAQTCRRVVTLRQLRLAFLNRWVDSGGSLEALPLISGIAQSSRRAKLDWEQKFKIAVHHQARIEL